MGALSRALPDVVYSGIGGERMEAAGLCPLFHARDLSVMGLTEVVGRLGAIRTAYARARAVFAGQADTPRPDLVILIDSPDFNLRLAAHARKAGIPVVYFIGPKIWAWRSGRIHAIARNVDHMLVILPFEEEIYREAGVPVTYVGNPLVDEQAQEMARAPRDGGWRPEDFNLPGDVPTVALLPGSRRGEIGRLLPIFLAAAERLTKRLPGVQFLLPLAPGVDGPKPRALAAASSASVTCVAGDAVPVLNAADAVAVASGTATLQAALAGVPGVIAYQLSPFTHWMARRLVRAPYAGLVNLVAGDEVVPELIQNATPERIENHLFAVLTNPLTQKRQLDAMARVRERLGGPGAPDRAAAVVVAQLQGKAA